MTKEIREVKKTNTEPIVPELGLYKKIFKLQRVLNGLDWEKDGRNTFQKYKYITEAQYKRNFAKALLEVGLFWKVDEVDVKWHKDLLDNMHLVEVMFEGKLIDPDTGECEVYHFSGTGADNGDKALYKAYTGGLKYFIATNFLIAEGNDPEGDIEIDKARKPQVPLNNSQKQEITNNLTSGKPTEIQLNALKKSMSNLIKKDKKYKEFVQSILDDTDKLTNLNKKQCEDYIIKINEKLKVG